jgi:hypothetical protein
VGLVAAYFAILEIWLRTVPSVSRPDVTATFDVLPFTVTNQSPFFEMYSVALKCDTTSYGLTILGSHNHKLQAVVVTNKFDILPQQSTTIQCSKPFIWDDPNAKELDEIAKVKMATMAVSAQYETKILSWKMGRESDPVSYAWETTAAGQHYWAPYDPNSISLDKYYSDPTR